MCEESVRARLLVNDGGDCRDLEINSIGDCVYPVRKMVRRACERAKADFAREFDCRVCGKSFAEDFADITLFYQLTVKA